MQDLIKKYGWYLVAIALFLGLVVTYFSPSVIDGKVLSRGDSMRFEGMVKELRDFHQNEGQSSEWLGSMFSGMPAYQVGLPGGPFNPLSALVHIVKSIDPMSAGMVLMGLIAFYILMCAMGIRKWLAIAGSVAYAFASYNIIIVAAEHISKAYAIAYMPLTIAGMLLLFNRKLIWGTVLFILGIALSVMEEHLQITYYLALFCVFIYLGFLYQWIKEKKYNDLLKVTGVMAIAVLIAVMPNAGKLYSSFEMSKTSTRGTSELTKKSSTGEAVKPSSGLDKDYAFQWSYGVSELLTLIIPDAYGGSSGGTLDSSSELYKEYKKNGVQVGTEVQAATYWGDKPFTSGPVYFGALVCFLFVLGMFVVRNNIKWWMFAGALFFVFLSLGRNFDLFNDFMFHYLPMYNKFRTVEMALVIPGLVFPIIAIWGLYEILSEKVEDAKLKKGLIGSLAITGGLCLIVWIMPSFFLSFQSAYDAQFQSQVPQWYYPALLMDRASLASSDAMRSLIFIVLGAALLFWFWKSNNKQKTTTWIGLGMFLLILIDLWTVDKRYLNDSSFLNKQSESGYKASLADIEILKDKDPSYRVMNLNRPFEEGVLTSYFHKSIGGYHAAKLKRYQELIENRLDGEVNSIINAFQTAQTIEDIMMPLANCPSLNMLNTRYIIYSPEQPPIRNPFAYGNAWFVGKVDVVENADAEIAALNTINPLEVAVVDKRFAADLNGFTPTVDSTATIKLDSYKPNKLVYTSKTASSQLAVFSEIYYQPGWKAFIDGKPAPHFRADWTLRAMIVPAGEHQITFEFIPETYKTASALGTFGSYFVLLLLLGAIGYSFMNGAKAKKEEDK